MDIMRREVKGLKEKQMRNITSKMKILLRGIFRLNILEKKKKSKELKIKMKHKKKKK